MDALAKARAALNERKYHTAETALMHAVLDEIRALQAENARLREALVCAVADLRHGLCHPSSVGIFADVIERLERLTTPGALP